MENGSLNSKLREVLRQIESSRELIEEKYEKFRIAITGTLRILGDNSSMLEKLQGSPDDVKAYVLKLVTEISIETMSQWESLHSQIEQILLDLPELHDRKS